jgi:hypothetical protein
MRSLVARSGAVLGKPVALLAAAGIGAGALGLLLAWPSGAAQAAAASLAASWLFFAALAVGGVALSAAARLAQGRWADPVAAALESGVAFFPAALVVLGALVLAAPLWLPRLGTHSEASWPVLAARDLLAAGLLFAAGARFARRSHQDRWGEPAGRAAVLYLIVFALAVSLWTVDLVIGLGTGEPSAIVPAQAFIAALLSAIAWAALLASAGAVTAKLRHDLGKLLFGFSSFWAYFVWCSFLPVWYANLPTETGELIDRTTGAWNVASFSVIAACFLLPFLFLMPEAAKKRPALLGVCSAGVLLGLGAERYLLVLRPLHVAAAPAAVLCGTAVALGVTGLFVLLVGSRLPPRPVEG